MRRTVVCCNTKNTVRLRGRLACSPVQICAVVRPGRYSVDAMSADADSLYGIYYECRSVCARGRGLSCAVCVRGVPAGEKRARARRGAGERARVRYARVSAVFGARDTPMTNGGGGVYGAQKGGKNATRGGGGVWRTATTTYTTRVGRSRRAGIAKTRYMTKPDERRFLRPSRKTR